MKSFLFILNLAGSSSGRSSAAAVYDVTAPSVRDPPGAAPMYDMHRKVTETSLGGNDIYDNPKTMSLYDTPKNATSSLYDTPKLTKTSLYDTPTNKATQLADIDENRLDYEPMQDQLSPISKCFEICLYPVDTPLRRGEQY